MEIKKIKYSELVKEMRQVVKGLGNYAVSIPSLTLS